MHKNGRPLSRLRIPVAVAMLLAGVALLISSSCTHNGSSSPSIPPETFDSADAAVQQLMAACQANDTDRLMAIMGSEGKQIISSGDDVDDRLRRQKFQSLYDEQHSLESNGPDRTTLVVGRTQWPFPVPLLRDKAGKWAFDAAEGREEILNRRIGQNELAAIEVVKAIGDAEHDYALRDPDGDGVHKYTKKIASDPGTRNGLYWPAGPGDSPSPLGELVAQAGAEGYTRRAEGPTPYHGYIYRILDAEGPSAPDGAVNYVAGGKMLLGFAVVAYPAEYGSSGIMTFAMGADGVVYQQNMGEDTSSLAIAMTQFDPDSGWAKVKDAPPVEPVDADR